MKSVFVYSHRNFASCLKIISYPEQQYQLPHANILKWWGEQQFEIQQAKAWQFGSLLFRLTRGIKEWRLEYHRPQMQHDYEQQWKNAERY